MRRSERPQTREKKHPRPRLMDTSRIDGVKAPRHRGTLRSIRRLDEGVLVVLESRVFGGLAEESGESFPLVFAEAAALLLDGPPKIGLPPHACVDIDQ